jgi:hypothetical protein
LDQGIGFDAAGQKLVCANEVSFSPHLFLFLHTQALFLCCDSFIHLSHPCPVGWRHRPQGPCATLAGGGLLVTVGTTCVAILVANMISIAFQTDLHTLSSKEQEQVHDPVHTNENENLEKFKKEIKKADETRLKAVEMELLELARTNNAVKADQELQETLNTCERLLEQVFVSPHKGAEISDLGGVPSICESWDENEAKGKKLQAFSSITPGTSKLWLCFHARALASLHGASFCITPSCHKAVDSLTPWLPQTVIPAQTNETAAAANITSLLFNRTKKFIFKRTKFNVQLWRSSLVTGNAGTGPLCLPKNHHADGKFRCLLHQPPALSSTKLPCLSC